MLKAIYRALRRRLVVCAERLRLLNVGRSPSRRRIDIALPMSMFDPIRKQWGDYYFAVAMKRELTALGYRVRLVYKEEWIWRSNAGVVIVLRGVEKYACSRRHSVKYVMWNISHPDQISVEECNFYDCVLFASRKMAERYAHAVKPRVGILLQAADVTTMQRKLSVGKPTELLFLANSRAVFRKILKDLLPTTHNLSIIGRRWDEFGMTKYVLKESVDYSEVGEYYRGAKIVLNDHWDSMRECGYVSNRCFDVLAAGGVVVSDYMPEIDEIFEGAVLTYKTPQELHDTIDHYLSHEAERKRLAAKGQALILEKHSFAVRMRELSDILKELFATTQGEGSER